MLDDKNWTKSKMFIPLWSGDCRYLMKNRIYCNSYQYTRAAEQALYDWYSHQHTDK